jgi:hypothetical protein
MLNNEDYLGIMSLALSEIAEKLANSIDPCDVRPILMKHLMIASIKWGNNEPNATKEHFLSEVKGVIDETQKWKNTLEKQHGH